MRKAIKEQILSQKAEASNSKDFILENPGLSYDEFDEAFTQYLCCKFMIEKAELVTDNFYNICQISADKAAHLPKGLLDASELASKCGGATTAMNKKVLFLLAVNQEYGIYILADEGAAIETFTQLKRLVFEKLRQKTASSGEKEKVENDS